MNKRHTVKYLTIFIIGFLVGWIITRSFYKDFIIENDFRLKTGMVDIDKRVLELLNNKEYDQAIKLFEIKVKYEISNLEAGWLIRGDSLYRDIIYPLSLDSSEKTNIDKVSN